MPPPRPNCSRCNLRNDITVGRALKTCTLLFTSLRMPHLSSLLGFALLSLGMVLTPGPNMIYLISRSITQGHVAGLISLGGVALGFVLYMLCAAFGITALLFAVPYAYVALRLAGAAYLMWLGWGGVEARGGV